MSTLKTQPTHADVAAYIAALDDEQQRADAEILSDMMRKATRQAAVIWGTSLIGFGSYHYKYASGQEGDWPLVAFAPRKKKLVVYIMPGFEGSEDLMEQLGKHKVGKSCLYINKLADVDLKILRQLIRDSVKVMKARYA